MTTVGGAPRNGAQRGHGAKAQQWKAQTDMAWKPMEPHERESIEAQVILKGAVELTAAQVSMNTTDPNEDILTTLTDNAAALTNILTDVKTQLGSLAPVAAAVQLEAQAVAKVNQAFTESGPRRQSLYLDDDDYNL